MTDYEFLKKLKFPTAFDLVKRINTEITKQDSIVFERILNEIDTNFRARKINVYACRNNRKLYEKSDVIISRLEKMGYKVTFYVITDEDYTGAKDQPIGVYRIEW